MPDKPMSKKESLQMLFLIIGVFFVLLNKSWLSVAEFMFGVSTGIWICQRIKEPFNAR